MTPSKRHLAFVLIVASVGVSLAYASQTPTTSYSYDNAGNLRGKTVTWSDSQCDIYSVNSCGTCGNKCPVPAGSTPTCAVTCDANGCTGKCDFNCNGPTWARPPGANYCVNLLTDANNCGSLGHGCPGVANGYATCSNGACGLACNSGYGLCSGQCRALAADVNNCGSCGRVCPGGANGYATCSNSTCGLACNSGYTLCSGQCRALASDVNNCGACGHVCPLPHAYATCSSGTCQVSSCKTECRGGGMEGDRVCTTYANCNGNPSDGCETALGTDSNCSRCGQVCSGIYYCNGSYCARDSGGH